MANTPPKQKPTGKRLTAVEKAELKCDAFANEELQDRATTFPRKKKTIDGSQVLRYQLQNLWNAKPNDFPMLWRSRAGDELPNASIIDDEALISEIEEKEADKVEEEEFDDDVLEHEANVAAGVGVDEFPEINRPEDKPLDLKECAEWVFEVDGVGVYASDYLGKHWTRMIKELHAMDPIELPDSMKHGDTVPWKYQLTGANKLVHLARSPFRGGILGDAMGLGKTLTTIIMLETLFQQNSRSIAIIVGPKSVLAQWEETIHSNVSPPPVVVRLDDTTTAPNDLVAQGVKYVLCSYQYVMSRHKSVLKFQETLGRAKSRTVAAILHLDPDKQRHARRRPISPLYDDFWQVQGYDVHLIMDEGHNIKNDESATFAAVKAIFATTRFYLSGTMFANRWQDCWAAVCLLHGHPFLTRKAFRKAFADLNNHRFGAPPTEHKFRRLVKFLQAITISRPTTMLEMPQMIIHTEQFEIQDTVVTNLIVSYVRNFCRAMAAAGSENGSAPDPGQAVTGKKHKSTNQAMGLILLAELLAANPVLMYQTEFDKAEEDSEEAKEVCDKFMVRLDKETNEKHRDTIFRTLSNYVDDETALANLSKARADLIQSYQFEDDSHDSLQADDGEQTQGVQTTPGHYESQAAEKRGLSDEPADQPQSKRRKIQPPTIFDLTRPFIRPDPAENPDKKKKKGVDKAEDLTESYTKARESIAERAQWLAAVKTLPDGVLFTPRIETITTVIRQIYREYKARKVLVFSIFRKELDLIAEAVGRDSPSTEKPAIYRFDGSVTKSEDRTKILRDFHSASGDQMKVLLITQTAGGAGLNIVAANHVIICEPWWRKADVLQAEARAWRQGQQSGEVHSWRIRCNNSMVDYFIQEAANEKAVTNERLEAYLRRKDDEQPHIPSQPLEGVA